MKVATLRLEMTLHFHLRTLKTSAGISMAMSRLTLTWQASRQPRLASPRLMKPVSVGSRVPPPSLTMTSHTPQAPLPPQAEGMKILLSPSVPSRVLPAATLSDRLGSSLMVMVTSPDCTSLRRAPSSSATRASTTTVNMVTPERISFILFGRQSWMPENTMKATDIRPAVTKVMPRPLRPAGTSEYSSFSRIAAMPTMAIMKPAPDPKPKTTLSPKL